MLSVWPSDIILGMSDPFWKTPDILTDKLLDDILRPVSCAELKWKLNYDLGTAKEQRLNQLGTADLISSGSTFKYGRVSHIMRR